MKIGKLLLFLGFFLKFTYINYEEGFYEKL